MKTILTLIFTFCQVFSSLFSSYVLIILSFELLGIKVFKWENFHFKPVMLTMPVLIVPNLVYSLWKGLRRIKKMIK